MKNLQSSFAKLAVCILALMAVCCLSDQVSAQVVDGGGGAPVVGDGGGANTPQPTQDNNLNADNSDTLGAGEEFMFLDADEAIQDDRNSGFVGAVSDDIQEFGFVGQATQLSGPATSGSFGGGAGGGGNNRGNQNRGGGNQGFNNNQNNGVVRQSIRSRVRYNFSPRSRAFETSTARRFNTRLLSTPVIRDFGQNVNVSIQNQRATITGFIQNPEQGRLIERQLRLEPGVYRIDNQLRTAR